MRILLFVILVNSLMAYKIEEPRCRLSPDQRGEMHYWEERSLFHLYEEEWPSAFQSVFNALHEVPEGCPDQTRLYNKLGHLYLYFDKSLGDAEGFYRRAHHNDPNSYFAMMGLGDIYRERKDWDTALFWYSKASQHYPKDARARSACGDIHYQLGKPYLAIRFYEEALEIEAKDPQTLNNLGNIYYEFRNFPMAKKMYQAALTLDPTLRAAWNNLGLTFLDDEDPRSAAEAFERSLKLLYEDSVVHSNLANAYFDMRQTERAKWHMHKALEYESHPVYHNNLAVMERFTREDKQAGIHYSKALAMHPYYSNARHNSGFYRRRDRRIERRVSEFRP